MIQKFKIGSFGSGNKFNWDEAFIFNTNNSSIERKIYINGFPDYSDSTNPWVARLDDFINMKITNESGIYYFNVLSDNLTDGTTVERNIIDAEEPDYFPGVPSDNQAVLEFIGSDDARVYKDGPVQIMSSRIFLRIPSERQFKMKIEHNKVIVVYASS